VAIEDYGEVSRVIEARQWLRERKRETLRRVLWDEVSKRFAVSSTGYIALDYEELEHIVGSVLNVVDTIYKDKRENFKR
jgi:hypothetical protein